MCVRAVAAFGPTKCRIKNFAKRRDFSSWACLQVRWRRLFPLCRRASAGGSLEAGTYAIRHAWPAVQLVAGKHSPQTRAQELARHAREDRSASHCVPACLSIRWLLSLPRQSLTSERASRFFLCPLQEQATARCVFHKPFKLLSSHTRAPLAKRARRPFSPRHRKIVGENIFFSKLFIYYRFIGSE